MCATKQPVMVCGCLERVVLESFPKIYNNVDGGLDAMSFRWIVCGCVARRKVVILPPNEV